MKLDKAVVEELLVKPGSPAALTHRSTRSTRTDWLGALGKTHPKEVAQHDLDELKSELEQAQQALYASGTWSLLVVLQGLDAAGKDGTIKHVMSGVNPQGCQVVSFKEPSVEELSHDFLWRCVRALPDRGHIGIFNRSYYEEVLVTRVHRPLIAAEHIPGREKASVRLWRERYEDINAFERHLERNGTRLVKLFLNVSKEEQRKRLLARLDDPSKQWKFTPSDVAEHGSFEEYQEAYEEALTATSTRWAPWYVVPADHKFALRALAGGLIVDAMDRLELAPPRLDQDQLRALADARKILDQR